jgi:riboflavin kinase/FMN adenylyltransferase
VERFVLVKNIRLKDIRKEDLAGAGAVMVIGFFDGVHRGHQEIIKRCIKKADETGGKSVAMTFDQPPINILKKGLHKKLILTYEDKVNIIGELGTGMVVTAKIEKDFLELSPEEFCRDILVGLFDIKHLFIGEGFRFGKGAVGDIAYLRKYLGARDITVSEVELVHNLGEAISSTMIRKYYSQGNIGRVRQLLGRDPFMKGEVVKGAGRGRKLGIPTVNIEPDSRLVLPEDGVYLGNVIDLGSSTLKMPAIVNIGDNPTFGDGQKRVESNILDFDGDMYGKIIRVDFLERLREEIKFDTADDLKKQIAKDIDKARHYFKL